MDHSLINPYRGNESILNDRESVFFPPTSPSITLFVNIENQNRKFLICCRKEESIRKLCKNIANIYFKTYCLTTSDHSSDEDFNDDQYYESVANDKIKVEYLTHNGYLLPAFHKVGALLKDRTQIHAKIIEIPKDSNASKTKKKENDSAEKKTPKSRKKKSPHKEEKTELNGMQQKDHNTSRDLDSAEEPVKKVKHEASDKPVEDGKIEEETTSKSSGQKEKKEKSSVMEIENIGEKKGPTAQKQEDKKGADKENEKPKKKREKKKPKTENKEEERDKAREEKSDKDAGIDKKQKDRERSESKEKTKDKEKEKEKEEDEKEDGAKKKRKEKAKPNTKKEKEAANEQAKQTTQIEEEKPKETQQVAKEKDNTASSTAKKKVEPKANKQANGLSTTTNPGAKQENAKKNQLTPNNLVVPKVTPKGLTDSEDEDDSDNASSTKKPSKQSPLEKKSKPVLADSSDEESPNEKIGLKQQKNKNLFAK